MNITTKDRILELNLRHLMRLLQMSCQVKRALTRKRIPI
jgi:hypothetical protein